MASRVWEHFKKNLIDKTAQCNYCNAVLQCKSGNTSGLIYHLSKHKIKVVPRKTGRGSGENLEDKIEEIVLSEQDLSTSSGVWRHFTKIPGEPNARCNHCNSTLKCKYGTTSGLLYHLSIHNIHIVPKKMTKRQPSPDILNHDTENYDLIEKDSRCRFCMRVIRTETVDITEIDEQYIELFEEITGIKFKSLKDFSKFACGKCCFELRKFGSLRQRFIENQDKIVKMLESSKSRETESITEVLIKKEELESDEEKPYEGDGLFSELFIKQETVADSEYINAQDILIQPFEFEEIPEESSCEYIEELPKEILEDSKERPVKPLRLEARKNYQCDLCGKEFLLREKIRLHLRSHTQIYPKVRKYQYTCSCGEKFKFKSEQVKHNMEMHPNEKSVVCHICARNFSDKRHFEVHMRRHSGIKPYQCDVEGCGKSFYAKEILKNHKKTHNEPTVCEICSKVTKNIKNHMQQHTGYKYKCTFQLENGNTCGRTFLTNSNLKHHIAIHAGELRYICKQCGIKYSRVNSLNYHIRTVHMNFRVKCTVPGCELEFVRKENLRCHIKSLHKNLNPNDFNEALEKIKLLKMPAMDGLK